MSDKSQRAFRTISEAADLIGVPQHVLRFWETRFPQLQPLKRGGNRRYYRPADMELLESIRQMLHDQGLTIRGAQLALAAKAGKPARDLPTAAESAPQPSVQPLPAPISVDLSALRRIRDQLAMALAA
jgi:DNA-binding transcriptional MerR regulator